MFLLQVGDAMQKLHDRKNIGKVILDPSQEPHPKVRKVQRTQSELNFYPIEFKVCADIVFF